MSIGRICPARGTPPWMRILTSLMLLLSAQALAQPLEMQIDAREAPRRVLRVHESVPVHPGKQTLLYPKWLPGEHGPTGPLNQLVDLQIKAGGQSLPWERDPLDMYRIGVVVPTGVTSLELDYAVVGGFSGEKLGVISFNEVLLYPAGPEESRVHATVQLPSGWKAVSALHRTGSAGLVDLPETERTTLVDSPLLMGEFINDLPVPNRAVGGAPSLPHAIHIAAERAAATRPPAKFQGWLTNLVEETGALFGSRHYRHYDWLLSLTDMKRDFGGLEHHESSDNVMPEDTLLEEKTAARLTELLAHEFVHSWCGKYRRPAGLLSPDYQKPMDTRLLWVYEGLTTFWGEVLPVRAGAIQPEHFRDALAAVAATFEHSAGKRWRSLADTATAAQLLYAAPESWHSWRRSVDFYPESILLWLEVDAKLRELSSEKVTLDDFCRDFFGGASGQPAVKPYEEDEVYATLNRLVPHDWRHDIRARLDATDGKAFLSALERSGWRLVYNDRPNEYLTQSDTYRKGTARMFSLGLTLNGSGEVSDVDEQGPAGQAGVAPGMNVMAVNGRKYTSKILDEAIKARQPVRLLVQNGDYFREIVVTWTGGEHIPHLERLKGTPDRLSALLKARR